MVISGVNTVTYNGDGITTAWPYTFPVTDDSEIRVQLNNTDGTAVIVEGDYYVDLVNSTVYYPGYAPGAEPPEEDQPPKVQDGQTITVYREIPMTQEADLGEKWPFAVIEKGLDKLTMIAQQIDSGTKRTIDNALASMEMLADVVVDSGKLQHITDQLNEIDDKAEIAEESADAAASSESNALSYKNAAAGSATSAISSATSASASATQAENLYNALIAQGGHPFQAATVADMTDTTKIYVYTGSEAGYTFGDWYYYDGAAWTDGGVYNAVVVQTDKTLSVSDEPADAKVTGDKINEVDGAVFDRGTKTLVDSLVRNAASGGTTNLVLDTTIATTQTVDVELTLSATTSSVQSVYWRNSEGNLNKIGDIPANESHVVFTGTTPSDSADRIRVNNSITSGTYTINITEDYVVNNVAKNAADIAKFNTEISKIGQKTPITELGTFERGYWNSVSTFTTSVAYRVGCRTPFTFAKDVVISAIDGMVMSGYNDGQSFSSVSTLEVKAGKELKLYVRRLWEDASETADVNEFTSGIFVLNYQPATEYERELDTFAGIEMFRTAGFVGDSYTATRLGHSWVDIIQGLTGVQCTKYAKSGINARGWINSTTNGLPVLMADSPKDLYWIAMGINDGDTIDENPLYLGTIADISGDDYTQYPNTYYGNMGHIIEAIQEHAPKAKIVLYKPIFKSIYRTLDGKSATQNGIKEVRDAIGEIAEHYELPVMDALDDVLYQSRWYATHMDSAVSNGTHPSVMLYPAIAKANMRLFSRCVRNYDSYFVDIRYDV